MNAIERGAGDDYDPYTEYSEPSTVHSVPITSKEQLGQEILRTYTSLSDPETIKTKVVFRTLPILARKIVLDEKGNEVEVEYIKSWEKHKFKIPVRVPPKYRDLISDDLSRAFLSKDDYDLYLDIANYCQQVRSFAKRYSMDLSPHYDSFFTMLYLMICGSGAVEGQRITLAKTDIAKSLTRGESIQEIQARAEKKKGGVLKDIMGNF